MRLAALLFAAAAPAFADTPQEAAADAIAQLQDARTQLAAAETRSNRIDALTETVQAYEAGLTAMRDGLRALAAQEAELRVKEARHQTELAGLLAVLQNIERTPTPVLQSHPNGAIAAARTAGIFADFMPAARQEVEALQGELARIAALRDLQSQGAETLATGLQDAQAARSALGLAISERTDLPSRFEQDPVQVALLQASTENLAAFAQGIAAQLPQNATQITPSGSLPLPVTGYVLPDDGSGQKGVRIAAAPGALVVTPIQATLLYAGPLPDWGSVAILEPAADVLFIIAGMTQSYGTSGQILPSGTAIGLMGGDPAAHYANLNEISDTFADQAYETLYLEVRDGQNPVNVDSWFGLE